MAFRITEAFKLFRIPYYGDYQLFDEVTIYLNKTKKIYCSNNTFLIEFLNNEVGSDNLDEYYASLRDNITNTLTMGIQMVLTENNIIQELTLSKELAALIKIYEKNRNIKVFSKYTPYIDYKNEYMHLVQLEDYNGIYLSTKLKSGIIDEILLKIMEYFNITTILMNEDNTILNMVTCQSLLIKLQYYILNQNENFEKIKQKIIKNEELFLNNNLTIEKCLLDNEEINSKNYYEQYLLQSKSIFYDVVSGYNSSFIQLSDNIYGQEYMVTKYNYPDFSLIERKRPKYLIINNLDAYSFMNYYFPYSYVNDKSEYLLNNLYAITFSNWILWIILFIIIFLICFKISRDITNPLLKLKAAIEQMSFNDKKIFKYKDDDNINELFAMCKELLDKDEFKKSLKSNSFLNNDLELEKSENNNYFGLEENNENASNIRYGANRNLIINSQMLEKNKKILNIGNKNTFDKEIINYKDTKKITIRPRNQSRKRPKISNKLINTNFNFDMPIKTYNKIKTKGDYNINSKLRDNFLRESMVSTSTKKGSNISFNDAKILNEISNKNDNELNILLYELLFCLGKNMFKPIDKEKLGRTNQFLKSERSLISNNDIMSIYNDSTKNNWKIYEECQNQNYNCIESIYENNDNPDVIYEDKKSNSDKENKEKCLKDQYQITFKKNNLYYKYIKAKNNWNNRFSKPIKNVNDLELDSNAMVELDDEDNYYNSLLPRKIVTKSDLNVSRIIRNSSLFSKQNNEIKKDNSIVRNSILRKSNIKTKKSLYNNIETPINLFGKEIINPNQRKLGMRASVSANMKRNTNYDIDVIKNKKTKFNLDSNIK